MTPNELIAAIRPRLLSCRDRVYDIFDIEDDSVVVGGPDDHGDSFLYKITPMNDGQVKVAFGQYIDRLYGSILPNGEESNGIVWDQTHEILSIDGWLTTQDA